MYSAPIPSYTQPGAPPTTQPPSQQPQREDAQGARPQPSYRPEEKKGAAPLPTIKTTTEAPRMATSNVTPQLVSEFMSIVKEGNMSQILSFISMLLRR